MKENKERNGSNHCSEGYEWVATYRKSNGEIVKGHCRRRNREYGYSAEIRESNATVVSNTKNPKITHQKGYIVTGFNPDGISLSEDYFPTKKEAEKHKRMIEKGDYY